MRLIPSATTLQSERLPNLGLRQASLWFDYSVCMETHLIEGAEAGNVIMQSENYTLRLVLVRSDRKRVVQLITTIDGLEQVVGEVDVPETEMILRLVGEGQKVKGLVTVNGKRAARGRKCADSLFKHGSCGGFVGCTLRLYTTILRPMNQDILMQTGSSLGK